MAIYNIFGKILKYEKYFLYILIVIVTISSCQVTRINKVNYQKGAILDTLIGKSQDITVASFLLNVIDICTGDKIPFVEVEISNNEEKRIYIGNNIGYLLVPNVKEGIYDLGISFIGYETLIIEKIEFSKKNDVWITVGLRQWHLPGHL
ncbi:MAG: hypothetical protein DRJ05_06255 [Bacteroidetes bacterium]|nr:MAG: hypothetical protein DRJ05_06255 [Bacteroidota bacterium]